LSDNETLFKELIVKAQRGDSHAYTEALTKLSSFLSRYLHKRIFEKSQIDEVTQEILLALHKSLHTYDEGKSFMSWFMAIVEFKIIDYIRSLEKNSLLTNIDDITEFFVSTNLSADLRLDLEKAISNLSAKEKNIFSLLKIEGQSVSEVAKSLNLSEANVKVIAHRTYINLKKQLGVGYENE
jgi:RNA polymerase sigma-70 factor, ECF subfamily